MAEIRIDRMMMLDAIDSVRDIVSKDYKIMTSVQTCQMYLQLCEWLQAYDKVALDDEHCPK